MRPRLLTLAAALLAAIFGAAWMSAAERLEAARARPTEGPAPSSSLPPENPAASSQPPQPQPPTTLPDRPELRGAKPPAAAAAGAGAGARAVTEATAAATGAAACQAAPPCPAEGEGKHLCCEEGAELQTESNGTIAPQLHDGEAVSCMAWRVCLEPGYSVDLTVHNVNLDPRSQYLLVAPDENSLLLHSNPVFTGNLSTEQKFRVPYKGSAYILFRANANITGSNGFHITYSQYGEVTTPEPSTTAGPVQPPPADGSASITVFLTGVPPDKFDASVQEGFRQAVATRTTFYCANNNITIEEGAARPQDVHLTNGRRCPATWPGSELCVQLSLSVAVAATGAPQFELSQSHMRDLWDGWGAGARITDRLSIYERSNFKRQVIIWAVTCTIIIILFCVFLTWFWRWILRGEYNEKAKISCSAPQEMEWPPMFEYMDQKYDDPEYISSYDTVYMGTESSTDDIVYGALPSYGQAPGGGGGSTILFPNTKQGVENDAFLEDEEEEYDILNRSKLTSGKNDTQVQNTHGANSSASNKDHVCETSEEIVEEERL